MTPSARMSPVFRPSFASCSAFLMNCFFTVSARSIYAHQVSDAVRKRHSNVSREARGKRDDEMHLFPMMQALKVVFRLRDTFLGVVGVCVALISTFISVMSTQQRTFLVGKDD